MVAPKKKKGEGTKKKKAPAVPMAPFEFVSPTVVELGARPSEFVRVKICGPALPHLNFEWPAVPTEVTLGLIKNAIAQRHGGGMLQMSLYKGSVDPRNELQDAYDGSTLKALGIVGVIPGAEGSDALPLVQLFYDFAAPGAGDPVVCVEPESLESRHDVSLKAFLREQRADRGRAAPPPGGGAGAAVAAAATPLAVASRRR